MHGGNLSFSANFPAGLASPDARAPISYSSNELKIT